MDGKLFFIVLQIRRLRRNVARLNKHVNHRTISGTSTYRVPTVFQGPFGNARFTDLRK